VDSRTIELTSSDLGFLSLARLTFGGQEEAGCRTATLGGSVHASNLASFSTWNLLASMEEPVSSVSRVLRGLQRPR